MRPPRLIGPQSPALVTALVLALAVTVLGVVLSQNQRSAPSAFTVQPPPAAGWFRTIAAGGWRRLPEDATCRDRVHRSGWEPRSDNYRPNHQMPDVRRVHRSFRVRPRAVQGAYLQRWDRWLLPRVTGHFTGTTDEIFQWVACKWGLSDNLLRAIAYRESGWYQYELYPDGTCVVKNGCGDSFPRATSTSRKFCSRTGRDTGTQASYPPGRCPKTFSIVGVMSWQDPAWGPMKDNQNGTAPFSRRSTAFAVDYLGAYLRGCYEGWQTWLANTGDYHPGNLRGCVGVWYAGSWLSPLARTYISRVWTAKRDHPWLRPEWAREELPCSPVHGCPHGVL